MPKPNATDAKLARLKALRLEPASAALLKELRTLLGDASNHVVAAAAEIVGELGEASAKELTPDLIAAYRRFLEEPEKKDKTCRAKIAIVEALSKLDCQDEDFYLAGIKYEQHEPAWGGPNDTAVPIRVASAFALVRLRHRHVLTLLVDMLIDEDKAARIGAVQALAATCAEAAALLLRLKIHLGDKEPEVIGECLQGMLEIQGEQAIQFVAGLLESSPEAIQEAALIALGEARLPKAFEAIRAFAEARIVEIPEVAFVAMALSRLPMAYDYLLTLVAEQRVQIAKAALAALAVHRYDPQLRERVAATVAKSNEAEVARAFAKKFGMGKGQ